MESIEGNTRRLGPPFAKSRDSQTKESAYFLGLNRNKKSITCNFKTKEGVEIIKRLAKECDVLIENYIPGKLDKYGLGYNDLKIINPMLIYTSVRLY